ncbi:MAG: hypothetical protein IPH32_04970 [Bacteroidetes bacterium]|nr:hypothetical protein [Bacteroidota bacterium]
MSGTPQEMGKQITNHFYKMIEYQISDPNSELNLFGSVAVSSIFSNIGSSNFPLNTPINTTYEVSPGNEINVQLSLNGLTGSPVEAMSLGNINHNSTTNGNNVSSSTTVVNPTNFGGSVTMTAFGTSLVTGGQTKIVVADAARLSTIVGSRYNHGFILRDKLQIWKERVPSLYPNVPANRTSQVMPIGTRVQKVHNAASDGEFTK